MMQRKRSGVPRREYELPLLRSLIELGGTVTPNENLYRLVSDKMGFTDRDEEYDLVHAREKWVYTLQWVRHSLVKQGYIDGSQRGAWSITEHGRQRVASERSHSHFQPLPAASPAPELSRQQAESIRAKLYEGRLQKLSSICLADVIKGNQHHLLRLHTTRVRHSESRLATLLDNIFVASEDWWQDVTSKPGVIQELILLSRRTTEAELRYQCELAKALNRLNHEFLAEFATPDYAIDWEKLVAFNSGKQKPTKSKLPREVEDAQYQQTLDPEFDSAKGL